MVPTRELRPPEAICPRCDAGRGWYLGGTEYEHSRKFHYKCETCGREFSYEWSFYDLNKYGFMRTAWREVAAE